MTTSDDIEITDQFPTREEAEEATAKGRSKTADLARHLLMLRTRGAHIVMGYSTWTEYVEREFGRSYRSAKYLIEFALLLKTIEERTGIEDPPLTEKGMRGAKGSDVETLVDGMNGAEARGEDPRAAADKAAKEFAARKDAERKAKADTRKAKAEAEAKAGAKGKLHGDDVENAPEFGSAAEPTPLPAKAQPFSYEVWEEFTLACRSESDAARMRSSFEGLMDSVDFRIHAADERQSA